VNFPSPIKEFIKAAKVLTYCTTLNQEPHCAICYYTFVEHEHDYYLLFKSSRETQHVREGLDNPMVAGSILPNRKIELSSNQGLQFNGLFIKESAKRKQLDKFYYKRFPFAKAVSGEVWAIQLTHLKMTDNTLGFGKKIVWSKENTN
jgi:uncharacterized protein YhbP (UPF0306 family)